MNETEKNALRSRLDAIHKRCVALKNSAINGEIPLTTANELDELLVEGDAIVGKLKEGARIDGVESLGRFLDSPQTEAIPIPINNGGMRIQGGTPAGQQPGQTDVRILNRGDKMERAGEANGLSFGGFLRSLVVPDERYTALNSLTSGQSSAGGYTVPTVLLPGLLDALRARSVLAQAGVPTMVLPATSGETQIARLDSDLQPVWLSETMSTVESQPTFGRVSFMPKLLLAECVVSKQTIFDSVNIEQALMDSFANALALEVDRAGLLGTGTGPEPLGVLHTDGVARIEHVGPDGGPPANYNDYVRAAHAVVNNNVPAPTAYIENPRTTRDFALLADSTNQPLMKPPILTQPVLSTTAIPVDGSYGTSTDESKIYCGYWPHLVWGVRNQLEIIVLQEPKYKTFSLVFQGYLRGDYATLYGGRSFAVIDGITE